MKALPRYSKQTQRIAAAAAVFCAIGIVYEIVLGIQYSIAGYNRHLFFLTSTMWNILEFVLAILFLLDIGKRPWFRAVCLFFCATVVYRGIWIPIDVLIAPQESDFWIAVVLRALGAALAFITIRRKWPYRERGIL
jgi:hypothetical protein